MGRSLGEFEQLILMAILRLGDDGYGAAIREEIERRTGRDVYVGAVYTALKRLESAGYLESRVGEPTPERGGRRKKFYRLLEAGKAALGRSHDAYRAMARGIEAELDAMADGVGGPE